MSLNVLRLTDSVEPAAVARTMAEYVVTPALADAFGTALGEEGFVGRLTYRCLMGML